MGNDTSRILQDLEVIMSTLMPDADIDKLKLRCEEIVCNYDINRKTPSALENDFIDKINLYTNALRLESYSESTIRGYDRELRSFESFVNKPPVLVNTPDIRNYLASNNEWSPGTVSRKLTTIKSFYRWCVDEEMLLRNPANKIKAIKQPKRLPKSFTMSQMEQIRQKCETLRDRALLEVFYSTGCRLSEVANMKTAKIDWVQNSIHVVGKGNKERIVYFNQRAIYHLKLYLEYKIYEEDECEYLFSTERRPYRQMNNASIRKVFKDIGLKTDIDESVHPHRFRHTMATLAMDNGIQLGDLQQLLGHSNPSTTLRYAEVSENRKKQAHKQFVQ